MKKNRVEEINIMQGINFRSNQERMREMYARQRKQQQKETILTFFIGIVIVVMTAMLLGYMTDKEVDKCVNAGHSETYCQVGL